MDKTYREIWGSEIERKGWTSILYGECMFDQKGTFRILDISSSGTISEWHITPPSKKDCAKEWVNANRKRLRTHGINDVSRLIVFNLHSRFWSQELFGLEYNIEPVVFRDMFPMPTHPHSHEHHLPQYITDLSPRHLDLRGWLGKLVTRGSQGSSGPKNISKPLNDILAFAAARWLT